MINFNSYYKPLANTTVYWLPMDTEELYLSNLEKKFSLLEKNNWINKIIEYKFNSYGFRSEEFTSEPGIMFLGCSLTIGIGIPTEHRWTDIVSNNLKLKCYNLGIGGGSNDAAFRMCAGYIDKINPKIVIHRIPPGIRIESVTDNEIDNITINSNNFNQLTNRYAMQDQNDQLNRMKNLLAIENLCIKRNIKFIILDESVKVPYIDYARDLCHPGIKYNFNYAQLVNQIIENN